MYGLYGIKHQTVEMLPCGTDERTTTSEDSATQLLICEALSLAIQYCWTLGLRWAIVWCDTPLVCGCGNKT